MIFHITKAFLLNNRPQDISEIVCAACRRGHFIKADKDSIRLIKSYVAEHGSTNEKESFLSHTDFFDITESLQKYLTTCSMDEDFPIQHFDYLVREPARVVIENANNEWVVYKHFIDIHKNDRLFGDIMSLLKKAKDKRWIVEEHAGGTGEIINTVERNAYPSKSNNIRLMKTLALFDRDTDDNTSYDGNKNSLFKYFSGKDYTKIKENDIYTLSQKIPFWHMWYKRAIENYFPNEQYESANCDVSAIRDLTSNERDYALLGGNKNKSPLIGNYKKSSLEELIKGLSRQKLEKNLKKFLIDGNEISEIQLLLLKLARLL